MQLLETNCDFTHDGRTFTANGATVTSEIACIYVSQVKGSANIRVTDWHGEVLGLGTITARWRQYHNAGYYCMEAVKFKIDGITYSGRYSPDYGNFCRARRTKVVL